MIWYPYQQMKTMKPPYQIVDAEGVYLYTENRKLIDSVSSWWSVIHGYKHPEINQAITEQLGKFAHVMLGGLTHEPAQKLSDKMQEWLPGDLDCCFFSDSGSVAVEVALKIALQYYVNRDETQRTMVLALEHAYHGDTFKAMEVGDDEDYHFVLKAYGKREKVIHIPTEIKALEKAFAAYHERLNCFIVEPLLQGAGGMRMYDISFLKRARELCDRYGVLLIFDEVATGFGRTGNRFVADLVLPDILVLGKALTGGYIGHAVTVTSHRVYEGFYDDDPAHALMHGPTFMGNALACSVALKSIELFEKQDYMSKIHRIEAITRREMRGFSDPRIKEIRIMGACVCVEVYDPQTIAGYQQFAFERGVFSRPFLNYMYAMVPYVITEEALVRVLDTMKAWFAEG
ncbi:adenosylmethionine--8-amino-7-oxononanoate transaminase [Agathobaculum sp. NSJ-28]|uniref:Adenosylmethionine-8-amino-7-oxononanoate aminotransferase n=2 Tax=Agathobaculum TaxID=2048137 RepID=A0A923RXY3_9FIRM|nr:MULTISPECIES: adenosylmethionine--8-amino-7-oxononanoate transaminase [Agathobaculum]MBC5724815.1 adenosylmethionine--8-amino-7-oxononanoate transaminase [Agathobaculum faecis]MCU6788256.1 adenosylmethionine--8-amino-7-oxononanoate transaminase [Agathobaculum ammoniilyticum]SCI67407.1 Adenosylmethionine-8-amino-7-oxononanoate aminotransferase [uncultured Butyricicoccus sp.]